MLRRVSGEHFTSLGMHIEAYAAMLALPPGVLIWEAGNSSKKEISITEMPGGNTDWPGNITGNLICSIAVTKAIISVVWDIVLVN